MADLLIRNLDPAVHDELKRRAGEADMSVQAYVTRVLDRHAAHPSLSEWLRRLDELRRHPEAAGAAIIGAARAELL